MVESSLITALIKFAPDILEFLKEINFDINRAKTEDIYLLMLIMQHKHLTAIIQMQTKLLNIMQQMNEGIAVLLKRTEY
jgi:hypothetical protein